MGGCWRHWKKPKPKGQKSKSDPRDLTRELGKTRGRVAQVSHARIQRPGGLWDRVWNSGCVRPGGPASGRHLADSRWILGAQRRCHLAWDDGGWLFGNSLRRLFDLL